MVQERAQVIKHQGKEVVCIDLTQLNSNSDISIVLDEAAMLIRTGPPRSKLIMTDVTKTKYTKETAELMKDFTSKNTDYVKASAVVGAEGVQLILLQTIIFLTRREVKTFDDREAALDWLVSVA